MRLVQIAAAGVAGLLAACGPSVPPDAAATSGHAGQGQGQGKPSAADLCVNNDCGEAIPLLDIVDAENLVFSPGGRLFVSGGRNVYEVTRDAAGAFAATPIADAECNFTGLTVHRNVLYASCADSRFFAGRLERNVTLTEIYRFTGMCIPNGTATGPDGRIYVVDEPLNCFPGDPKIVALTLDPTDPLKVTRQVTWVQGAPDGLLWVGGDNVLKFPNGLVRDGDTFYATDGGSVFSVALQADGSAGPVTPLFFEPTAHDDLGLAFDDGLLVTDFFGGRILLLSRDGELLQETLPGTFIEPSSVRLGQPPLFKPTDILVTDKGIITERDLPIDRLWLFRRKP
jgi:hypothetical protein